MTNRQWHTTEATANCTNNSSNKTDDLFHIRPGKNGCDLTFDVVWAESGELIASLAYWDDRTETLSDARLLQLALERFYRRGGYMCLTALAKTLPKLDGWSELGDDLKE